MPPQNAWHCCSWKCNAISGSMIDCLVGYSRVLAPERVISPDTAILGPAVLIMSICKGVRCLHMRFTNCLRAACTAGRSQNLSTGRCCGAGAGGWAAGGRLLGQPAEQDPPDRERGFGALQRGSRPHLHGDSQPLGGPALPWATQNMLCSISWSPR